MANVLQTPKTQIHYVLGCTILDLKDILFGLSCDMMDAS